MLDRTEIRAGKPAFMQKILNVCALFFCLAACSTAHNLSGAGFRELSAAEKVALARVLPANLPSPGATQFRWGPVARAAGPGAHTGYCAELNGRNPDGGSSGYRRFFALLAPGPNGEFRSGSIQSIAGPASDPANAETRRVIAACRHWGYAG